MAVSGFALFDTAIGACGIAWGQSGIVGLQLPEAARPDGLARLRRRFPDLAEAAPPPDVRLAIGLVAAHLDGAGADYREVRLDLARVGAWERAVYRLSREIAPGRTTTYGALAARLGDANKAQAVGQALGRNPWPIIIPCHRVTGADGKVGGFSAPGGRATKLRLLEIEGACAAEALPLFGGSR